MSFYGRNRELQRLEKLYLSGKETFILLKGRKSVGKSAVLRKFSSDRNALYFNCANVSDALNRKSFSGALSRYFPDEQISKSVDLSEWRDLLKYFSEHPTRRRKILIFDNFDFLIKTNPDILNQFKTIWNNFLRPNNVMFVIAMHDGNSSLHMKDEGKALMACVTNKLRVEPFSFMEMMQEYPHHDFNQLMMLYSITGGVPYYFEYFRDCIDQEDFFRNIRNYMMNPYGSLFPEVANFLEYEVNETTGYHSVLFAMATGKNTIYDISTFTGLKEFEVESILNHLGSMNLISRRVSIIEKKIQIGRKPVRFAFKDPFMAFWYTFIFPYFEEIKSGYDQSAYAALENGIENYLRQWFIQISKDTFKLAGKTHKIPIQCEHVGTFFNKDFDIDVVGINHEQKQLFLGTCSFCNGIFDKPRFDQFVSICDSIKELRAYKDYTHIYGVFSNLTFSKDLIDYAMLNQDALLFNGITIYSINS